MLFKSNGSSCTPSINLSSLVPHEKSSITNLGVKIDLILKLDSWSMRHFHTWIGHHRVHTSTTLRIFGMCWRRLCHHHNKILAKKINAILDGNKSWDIAEAYRNNGTANACRNQSKRQSSKILKCDFFLGRQCM